MSAAPLLPGLGGPPLSPRPAPRPERLVADPALVAHLLGAGVTLERLRAPVPEEPDVYVMPAWYLREYQRLLRAAQPNWSSLVSSVVA